MVANRAGRLVFVLAVAVVVSGCAAAGASPPQGAGTPAVATPAQTATPVSPAPTPPQSLPPAPTATPPPPTAAGLRQFDAAALAFVDRFNADWADAPKAFAGFTPDAVVIDPSNADFTIGPRAELVQAWASFVGEFPRYQATSTAAYVSDDAAAFQTEVAGLPVGTPDGLLHELRVFRFTDGTASAVTEMELWYDLGSVLADAGTRLDCVPPDRCADDVMAFAEQYLSAWVSGDERQIAELYRPDSTVTDGVRGIRATGATAIGRLSDQRFGGTAPACQVRDVFVQTDAGDPRTSDNTDPKGGSIAGIAILHHCDLGTSGSQRPVDGVTLLLFGTRQAHSFDNDPDGRIVRDEILYDAASAIAAGIVR